MLSALNQPINAARLAPPLDHCRFVIGTDDSARLRFPRVESHAVHGAGPADGFRLTVALPLSFRERGLRRYPLLLLADGTRMLGASIEMARVLVATKEAGECIVVSHDDPWLARADAAVQAERIGRILQWCQLHYRVKPGEVALFAAGRSLACTRELLRQPDTAIDRWIVAGAEAASLPWPAGLHRGRPRVAWATNDTPACDAPASVAVKRLPESTGEGLAVPALCHGIRSFWGSGRAYGDDVMPLSRPLVERLLRTASPLIRRLRREPAVPVGGASRHVLRSQIMDRDFEIFVGLPRGRPSAGGRYPAVLALDANSTWSCISEIAARMIDAGEIEDLITVGIGVPRAEGEVAFGLRRFEEFSPPAEGAFEGALGRFFLSIFSLFGRDARQHFGGAPLFHRFLSEELLPQLMRSLPIDPERLSLVGHSAGGTYAAYERAQADTPFAGIGSLSPGVAISRDWMLAPEDGLAVMPRAGKLLVTMGGEEQDNAFNRLAGIPQAEHYAEALRQRGQAGSIDYACLDGETHTTVLARAYALLLTRFHPKKARDVPHV
ncbi:alpha/beta hydrolase [Solimonas sp. SE-A11]|uniref:alpha/beta hydrolase n=1 Tax=Solimonas sp. SE-A11 TaxID=3054954 RepID=UPI00259CC636|nr:alpha/beta hydrolase-fold protein [Solimonas sp. SE-A11]MDM4769829.1 alpha/beta hydrolase-fold protein [Solimonas sp. SE-A11]